MCRVLIIAVASSTAEGLEGRVADTLARAPYYTIVALDDCRVESVRVVENPASTFSHGVGPIVAKMLLDMNASLLAGPMPGESFSSLLKEHGIRFIAIEPGVRVSEAVSRILSSIGC